MTAGNCWRRDHESRVARGRDRGRRRFGRGGAIRAAVRRPMGRRRARCLSGWRNDDLKVTFTAKRLDYYASACRIVSSRRLSTSGDAAHRVKVACEGEGAKSAHEVILIVLEKTEQRPELLLHIDALTWDTLSYQRCSD